MSGARGFDTSTPAVVLKFDPNVLHHGGLGLIRSLGRFGVPVFGVHERPMAPAAYSRYLAGRWLWRPNPAHAQRVLGELDQIARSIGRPSVLLPTDDAAAIFLAEHGHELRGRFLLCRPPDAPPRVLAGKFTMYQLCRELGIPCPESVLAEGWDDAQAFADRVGFPVIGKLSAPWQSSGATRSTVIVRTVAELRVLHRTCQTEAGDALMLQEFVPGDGAQDWFFHGYCDASSRCEPAFTGRKERSYPAHAGATSMGIALDNAVLRAEARRLLRRVGFRGIVDLDFRYDARDGRYKLLDFNPRLGAQFRLFRDARGIDVGLAAYLDLTGQPVSGCDAVPGRRFLVENHDPIAAAAYWRRGELGLKHWAGSLRGVDETAWFARDDPLPFVLMCLWMGWRGATRSMSRTKGGATRLPDQKGDRR